MRRRLSNRTAIKVVRWLRAPPSTWDTERSMRRAQRIVLPLRLEFWGRAWTLTAWRELRSDVRVFRVERIENLEVTDRGFRDERGKSYKDYLDAAETPY